jgi:S-adenosyl-L-methionine hydrolase (adenosine-forming)
MPRHSAAPDLGFATMRGVPRAFISFLSDFGPDGPAPICRGVMLGIAPDANIVDVGHSITKYAIAEGAYLLESAAPYLPVGVHVAVVDPGVGTERLPIAIRTARGDILIGPDNGLLMPAAEALGGAVEARALENRDLMLPRTSSTFHGRDVFSPVAAHLAMGTPFESVGPEIPVASLVALGTPRPEVSDGELRTAVLYVDSFGNVRFAAQPADLARAIGPLEPGRRVVVELDRNGAGKLTERTTWEQTFGRVPVGRSLLFEDSLGRVSLADNQANAATRLGATVGTTARIRAG